VKRKLALLAVVVLALTGCSSISEGTITEKNHREGYYYPVTYCAAYSSKGACIMFLTRQDYMPESWWFDITQDTKDGWVYVGEDTYERYEVGDYYGK
jgi:uncharacterized protein YceK